MKKIFTIAAALLMTASVWAQAPEKMSYQAVVRDAGNALVTSTAVGMQISILQTTATGTAVYVETQTPTSNANGLVSLEIGSGTVVSGTFNTIDWANDTYFIKTETDPTGGTSYTISGTSQLMSVPYALHSKTADNIVGGITETDPIFGASLANGITGTDTTNWNNKLDSYTETDPIFGASVANGITGTDTTNWYNKQDQLSAGTGIDITNNVISTTGSSTLAIGDSYQGGKIFWLDASGQHGLIAAIANQTTSSGTDWYYQTSTTSNAGRDGIGAGKFNTERIIANQGTGEYAAQLCANYQGGNYGDWYLPSKYELNLLYLQKTVVGGFGGNHLYWSSTEDVVMIEAISINFNNGLTYSSGPNLPSGNYVRAVRAF